MPVIDPIFVQSKSVFQSATLSPDGLSCTFDSNVTLGNFIIVVVGYGDSSNTFTETVTDSLGNSYSRAGGVNSNGSYGLALWYAKVSSGGGNTVTLKPSSADAVFIRLGVHEYSNLDTFDQIATSQGPQHLTDDIPDSGPLNISFFTKELLFGWAVHQHPPLSPGDGFTLRETINGEITEDKVINGPGIYDATALPHAYDYWWMLGASFYLFRAGVEMDTGLSMQVNGNKDGLHTGYARFPTRPSMNVSGGVLSSSPSQPAVPVSSYFQVM